MAGQMIMQGFVGFHIPLWLRRLATMLPAIIVVAYGVDAMHALVLSQVVLSVALPFPMIALIWVTGRADLMGRFVNRRTTQVAAIGGTAVVLLLNFFLIVESIAA
jgi:manganese transport protein